MNVYTNRLDTYSQHRYPWPYIGDARYDTAEQFAMAGFYNVATRQVKDKVQCYMCGLILNNWKPGESPAARHGHASPTCSMVVLNFPNAHNPITELYTQMGVDSELLDLARLETFIKHNAWPPSVDGTKKQRTRSAAKQLQSPYPLASKMVEAGFMFLPTQEQPDLSMCSYCGFHLSSLGIDPDIWTEHQNHASDCLFIKRWEIKAISTGSSIVQERHLSPESKEEAVDNVSPPNGTLNSATKLVDDNGPSTATNGKHRDDDSEDIKKEKSTSDDSIWDIASVQLKNNGHDLTTKRKYTAYTTPHITYTGKKRKRSTKLLSPAYSKKALLLTSLDQSIHGPLKKQHSSTMQHDRTQSSDTSALLNKEKSKETAAQLFTRLQKRPHRTYTSQEKGKGRARDILPPSLTTTSETIPFTPKRLSKNSLRLSTNKKHSMQPIPAPGTTNANLSSSSTISFSALSSPMVPTTSSSSATHIITK